MVGGKFLKAWSKTMEVLALSSGESELGALVKACAEGIRVQSLLADYGVEVKIKILSDSTAAIGMVRRLGLGRVRHLATADLWVQHHLRSGSFTVAKHPGHSNSSDLMTKVKGREDLTRLLALMNFAKLDGRAATAPSRTAKWNVSQVISPPKCNDATHNHLDTYMLEGRVDSEPVGSGIIHHYPSTCAILEGRRLTPSQPLPSTPHRLLYSVMDLNTGEEIYHCERSDDAVIDGREPDLMHMVKGQNHPLLLAHWINLE